MEILDMVSNKFLIEPKKVDKYTDKDILKYSIGTNLYTNGFKNFYKKIVDGEFLNLGSISICFEDATREEDLGICEENVRVMLEGLKIWKEKNPNAYVPLLFVRIRNLEQFKSFTKNTKKEYLKLITGFIFPKFNSENGRGYFEYLTELINDTNEVFYAMPIIEDEKVIYKESRIDELIKIKNIIDENKDVVLNIRVGGTDFSSKFGLRRSKENTIYNIGVVSDCLFDILNMFSRQGSEYVISAPVWEYFSSDLNSEEMQGFIREIKMDKENGFIGKTIIHPLQINIVNALYAVTFEEYTDAKGVLKAKDGVFKGYGDNKMNEAKPHTNWAKKILKRAEVFGVLNEGVEYKDLI